MLRVIAAEGVLHSHVSVRAVLIQTHPPNHKVIQMDLLCQQVELFHSVSPSRVSPCWMEHFWVHHCHR